MASRQYHDYASVFGARQTLSHPWEPVIEVEKKKGKKAGKKKKKAVTGKKTTKGKKKLEKATKKVVNAMKLSKSSLSSAKSICLQPVNRVAGLDSVRVVQIAAGSRFFGAVSDSGELWLWGRGLPDLGVVPTQEMHAPGAADQYLIARKIEIPGRDPGDRIVQVSCGAVHCLVRMASGKVAVFGQNYKGQLGLGANVPVHAPVMLASLSHEVIVDICAGTDHSLALSQRGVLYSWGSGHEGQLGHGTPTTVFAPTPVSFFNQPTGLITLRAIAAATQTTICVSSEGDLYEFGEPLDPSGERSVRPRLIGKTAATRSKIRDLEIIRVYANGRHCAALSANGDVYTWGENSTGQLGQGVASSVGVPKRVSRFESAVANVSCGLAQTFFTLGLGHVYCCGRGVGSHSTPDSNVPVLVQHLLTRPVVAVACGWISAIALSANGEVLTWCLNQGLDEEHTESPLPTQNVAQHFQAPLANGVQPVNQTNLSSQHSTIVSMLPQDPIPLSEPQPLPPVQVTAVPQPAYAAPHTAYAGHQGHPNGLQIDTQQQYAGQPQAPMDTAHPVVGYSPQVHVGHRMATTSEVDMSADSQPLHRSHKSTHSDEAHHGSGRRMMHMTDLNDSGVANSPQTAELATMIDRRRTTLDEFRVRLHSAEEKFRSHLMDTQLMSKDEKEKLARKLDSLNDDLDDMREYTGRLTAVIAPHRTDDAHPSNGERSLRDSATSPLVIRQPVQTWKSSSGKKKGKSPKFGSASVEALARSTSDLQLTPNVSMGRRSDDDDGEEEDQAYARQRRHAARQDEESSESSESEYEEESGEEESEEEESETDDSEESEEEEEMDETQETELDELRRSYDMRLYGSGYQAAVEELRRSFEGKPSGSGDARTGVLKASDSPQSSPTKRVQIVDQPQQLQPSGSLPEVDPVHRAMLSAVSAVAQDVDDEGPKEESRSRAAMKPIHHPGQDIEEIAGHLQKPPMVTRSDPTVERGIGTGSGLYPLHEACENDDAARLRQLINVQHFGPNERNAQHLTPLHVAAMSGATKCVDYLTRQPRVSLNSKDLEERTPLHLAILNRKSDCAALLVQRGGMLNMADLEGSTPLHLSLMHRIPICATLLMDAGANIDAQDSSLRTPLHLACFGGHLQMVQALLDRGVDVDRRDADGGSPLHFAAMNGHKAICCLLLSHGARVKAVDAEDCTPLHLAAGKGFDDVARTLLENGCPKSLPDRYGRTPLHYAARHGHMRVLRVLVDAGADKNAGDAEKRTPMEYAYIHGHIECVTALIKYGSRLAEMVVQDDRFHEHIRNRDSYRDVMMQVKEVYEKSPEKRRAMQSKGCSVQ